MPGENSPSVSVIIPVYNVEEYLPQCLDTILAQTLNDIEVICVDDGSVDESYTILKQYAEQDNRLRILSQQNQYAGVARNRGLALASGDYVIFLDSDDFFVPEMLEHAYKTALENQTDIVLFNGYRYDDKDQKVTKTGDFLRDDLLPQKEIFSWIDVPNFIFALSNPAPWCKLYNRQFLLETGLQFSTQPHSNDSYFTLLSLALAHRITALRENLIYYRINRPNSLQYSKHNDPLCFLTATEDLYNELVSWDLYKPLQTSFRHKALSVIISNLRYVKTDQARWQILDALDSGPFSKLPIWEIPGIDDENHQVHNYSCLLANALTQYHRSLHLQSAFKELNNQSVTLTSEYSIRVSVIIPVYNTEKYLDETLASVTGQTLSDIEIICIDDGSVDNSLDILNHWAAIDNRITVFTQPNTGQGFARNVGIAHAHGEYLYLMDSDDLLENDALEQLVDIMDKKQLDSLYFDASTFFETEEIEKEFIRFQNTYIRNCSYDDVYDGPTLLRLFCNDRSYRVNVYLQFHRTSFIREKHLSFPGVIHDDNAFTFGAILQAKRVSHIQHPFIKRRMRPDSLMTKKVTFDSVYGYYRDYLEMLNIYQSVYDSLTEESRNTAFECIRLILSNSQNDFSSLKRDQRGGELGLLENLPTFYTLVGKVGQYKLQLDDTDRKLKKANNSVSELQNKNITLAEQIKALEEQNDYLLQEPDRIHASFSYRLGRALTLPLRKIRNLNHKLHEIYSHNKM